MSAAAVPGRRGGPGRRTAASAVSLHRPAAPAHGAQPGVAPQGHQVHSRFPERPGLPRGRDAHPGQPDARRRARLPGAQSAAPRQLLRPAAESAAVQTTVHGGWRRSLLSDRTLLQGRRPARQSPARVHPARPRNVVRRAGGRARRVRGALYRADRITLEQTRARQAMAADYVAGGDGPLRLGQARPAL